MDRGGRQQRRDRRILPRGLAVTDHQRGVAGRDGLTGAGPQVRQRPFETRATLGHRVMRAQHLRREATVIALVVDVDDLGEFVVVQHRPRQQDLPAGGRRRIEDVLLRTHHAGHRGDDFFADGVERRIGHLRKQFHEVVVEQTGPLREHRDRGVGAHRPERLVPRRGHRGDQHPQLFLGVAERHLATDHRFVARDEPWPFGQAREFQQTGMQPFLIRLLADQLPLDLGVRDTAGRPRCRSGTSCRARAAPWRRFRRSGCRGHRPPRPGPPCRRRSATSGPGRRPLRSSTAPTRVPSVKVTHAGPSQASISEAWNCRNARRSGIHVGDVLPGLGDHHHHAVRNATATEMQQFEHLVE